MSIFECVPATVDQRETKSLVIQLHELLREKAIPWDVVLAALLIVQAELMACAEREGKKNEAVDILKQTYVKAEQHFRKSYGLAKVQS